MISIIVSSQNSILFNQLADNIEKTIGVEHEIICIKNEALMGICEAYNLGASKAKFEYLVFCHEDILHHTQNWGKILIDNFDKANARLIGVLGSTIKTDTPSNIYLHHGMFNRQNQLQRSKEETFLCYQNPYDELISEVCTVDGFFIATKKISWEETKFSEDYLKGFHGYDIDFSLKNFQFGKNIVVYDILIEHLSYGSFNKEWINAQILLVKKWENILPLFCEPISKYDIKLARRIGLKDFLHILFMNNTDKKIILQYLIQKIYISPLDNQNIRLIKRFIFNDWNGLKKYFFKP